jgi:integrase
MASIKKIENKNGVSYQITVSNGRDSANRQKRYYLTWTPGEGMTQKQIDKEVQKQALDFERQIDLGYAVDNKQTFTEYALYVIDLKERNGVKHRTIVRYRELMKRIDPAIGHIKLADLRPQHLNSFYKNLGESGIRKDGATATARVDLFSIMKEKNLTRAAVAAASGVAPNTLTLACKGKKISLMKAEAIAKALEERAESIFKVERDKTPLSNKTIAEHHRLISTILKQAEKEMLVQYNAASKATPPKLTRPEVNYFQVEDIERIRDYLDQEPIKWRVITHLLLITGCRRGEIAGLKWSKVDFFNNQIKIDTALLYAYDIGIYEDTTKTNTVRYIKLPQETMDLLKQYSSWYYELQEANGDRWQNTEYLFVQDNGAPMNPDSITGWLNDFSKRHDLPHINPHAFRHTMASVLISNGKDIVSVSKRLGHAKVSTTTDIYSHIIKKADEEASDCLADVMLRKKTKVSG